jgi:hypothetical protein
VNLQAAQSFVAKVVEWAKAHPVASAYIAGVISGVLIMVLA